jgi:hypothetical protein
MANNPYHVRLHFSENYATAPGGRLFNVIINGVEVLTNIDLFLAADSSNYRAVIEDFNTIADQNGLITIQFTAGSANNPKINGIEIGVAPPSAPANLVATAGNGQIALQWAASAYATTYNVQRAIVSGGPYSVLASISATNYVDSTVTDGVAYYYVVTAVGAGGQSATSVEASATAPVPQLSAFLAGGKSSQLQISWPSWAANFHLYTATNLSGSNQWQPTTNAVQTNNGTFYLVLPTTNLQQYFHLSTR